MMPLMLTTIAGGLADSILLIKTPAQSFLRLLPWLMLAATGLIAFEKVFTRRISAGISHDASNAAIAGAAVLELIVALYGGYFLRRRNTDHDPRDEYGVWDDGYSRVECAKECAQRRRQRSSKVTFIGNVCWIPHSLLESSPAFA
jgi:hypothetical protein